MLRSLWSSLPLVSRIGLGVAAAGLAADVLHHGFIHQIDVAQVPDIAFIGHVLTLAGMVLALSGVVLAAADMRRRVRQKGESNAARSGAAAPR